MRQTIYETITNQIVTAIEEGASTYQMPWHRLSADITCPTNAASGRSYRGLNVITLWMIAQARGFRSGTWATYQQWQEKGAQVRKGEKSASVFFWKNLAEGDPQDGSDEPERARFVARAYNVFNAEQVDGYQPEAMPLLTDQQRDETAERFFAAIPATVEHGGDHACYTGSRCRPHGALRAVQRAS
jgi:antirestriction protein ArdC